MRRGHKVDLMLARRLRRQPSIKPTWNQRLMFAWSLYKVSVL